VFICVCACVRVFIV